MNKAATSIQIETTTLDKFRGLPWVLAMNASLAVHARFLFFGSSFVLFLNQIGFNKTQIGGLLSLLPFWGLIAIFANVESSGSTWPSSVVAISSFFCCCSPLPSTCAGGPPHAFLYIAGLISHLQPFEHIRIFHHHRR